MAITKKTAKQFLKDRWGEVPYQNSAKYQNQN